MRDRILAFRERYAKLLKEFDYCTIRNWQLEMMYRNEPTTTQAEVAQMDITALKYEEAE